MTTDTLHALSAIAAVASLCVGTYMLAGLGAALCLFGGLVLSSVVYARTRVKAEPHAEQPD